MLVKATKLDPRVKRTRQLLEQALGDLLKEKTFHAITVQDIAERAEVNRATFYAHFEDKYALLNYSVRTAFQALLNQQLPPMPLLTVENLHRLMLTMCDYLGGFIGHCAPYSNTDEQGAMLQQVQVYSYEVILEWTKRTPPQTSSAPEVVAMVCSWAMFGAVLHWAHEGRKYPPEQLVKQVLEMLTSGLSSYL